jgi:putative SOS response-associated peptidase YedK
MMTDIAEEFSTKAEPERMLPVDWNIKPTQDIYIIRQNAQGVREVSIASWGMIAPWSKTSTEAQRSQSMAINARSESVHEKPTFRKAFKSQRCLVPASGYYEWATALGPYKTKQPFFISRDDGKLISFAGIFDLWQSPEGEIRESVSIITRDAEGELGTIHNRMPVCMPKDRWEQWLDQTLNNTEGITSLMSLPNPQEHLRFWPVRDLINSIRNSGPELAEPVALGDSEVLF